ncbi:OmpA family protein [Streptomyces sp. NBC_01565]|uniref:OmpA family protein n=1 Tax=unclassified Streptomyces TaxID=2593676 RepID=UPI00225B5F24|nr:OmpA family protein [Streptomyces sp. NBC_01565]MCX4546185.1 OmpA family protein [Streptomyces sp. NBC_01565]
MTETVYFARDSAELSPSAQAELETVAQKHRAAPVNLTIIGHTDERGTEEHRFALGERRAEAVRQHLSSRGVPDDQLSTVSRGGLEPADPGHSPASWAKNNRVVVVPAEG